MQFALPSNLKSELIPYDSTLKALAKIKREEKATTSKPRFPLGKIPIALQKRDEQLKETNGNQHS